MWDHIKLIRELISLEADLNAKNNKGNTPLGLFGSEILDEKNNLQESKLPKLLIFFYYKAPVT